MVTRSIFKVRLINFCNFKNHFLTSDAFYSFYLNKLQIDGCLPHLLLSFSLPTKGAIMKKLRKGTQLKLENPKNAGRPAIHDKGIRHTSRQEIRRPTPLHLTVKLIRADIQNKLILQGLRHAILRARLQGLRVIHYSLEKDHVHLYVESSDNLVLAKGMKAFGVALVKRINKFFKRKGSFYKTRYHLRLLKSATEVKNVLNYILKNGIKHKRSRSIIDPYNSALAFHDFKILGVKLIWADNHEKEKIILKQVLDELLLFRNELRFVS